LISFRPCPPFAPVFFPLFFPPHHCNFFSQSVFPPFLLPMWAPGLVLFTHGPPHFRTPPSHSLLVFRCFPSLSQSLLTNTSGTFRYPPKLRISDFTVFSAHPCPGPTDVLCVFPPCVKYQNFQSRASVVSFIPLYCRTHFRFPKVWCPHTSGSWSCLSVISGEMPFFSRPWFFLPFVPMAMDLSFY